MSGTNTSDKITRLRVSKCPARRQNKLMDVEEKVTWKVYFLATT